MTQSFEAPLVLVASGKGCAVYDIESGRTLLKLDAKPTYPVLARIDADNILVSPNGRRVDKWDVRRGLKLGGFDCDELAYVMVRQPGSGTIFVASFVGSLSAIDPTTLKTLWTVRAHNPALIQTIRFSRDGTRVLLSSSDDTASIWEARTGKLVCRLVGHSQSVDDGDFSLDGTRVITASDDRTVRVWDATNGTELMTLGDAGDYPKVCQITQDGKYLVTASQFGTIKIWPIGAAN